MLAEHLLRALGTRSLVGKGPLTLDGRTAAEGRPRLQRTGQGFWGPKGRTSCWGRRGFPVSGPGWLGFEFPLRRPRPVHSSQPARLHTCVAAENGGQSKRVLSIVQGDKPGAGLGVAERPAGPGLVTPGGTALSLGVPALACRSGPLTWVLCFPLPLWPSLAAPLSPCLRLLLAMDRLISLPSLVVSASVSPSDCLCIRMWGFSALRVTLSYTHFVSLSSVPPSLSGSCVGTCVQRVFSFYAPSLLCLCFFPTLNVAPPPGQLCR